MKNVKNLIDKVFATVAITFMLIVYFILFQVVSLVIELIKTGTFSV